MCARYNIDEGINETVRRGGTLDGETAIHSEYVTCSTDAIACATTFVGRVLAGICYFAFVHCGLRGTGI